MSGYRGRFFSRECIAVLLAGLVSEADIERVLNDDQELLGAIVVYRITQVVAVCDIAAVRARLETEAEQFAKGERAYTMKRIQQRGILPSRSYYDTHPRHKRVRADRDRQRPL